MPTPNQAFDDSCLNYADQIIGNCYHKLAIIENEFFNTIHINLCGLRGHKVARFITGHDSQNVLSDKE